MCDIGIINPTAEELYDAVSQGNIEDIQELVNRGACATFVCASGQTALGVAAQLECTTILQILLQAGRTTISPSQEHPPSYNSEQLKRHSHHARHHRGRNYHQQSRLSKRTDSDDSESTVGWNSKSHLLLQRKLRLRKSCPRNPNPKHTSHEPLPELRHSGHRGSFDESVTEDSTMTSNASGDDETESSAPLTPKNSAKKPKKNVGYFIFVHNEEQDTRLEGINGPVDENRNETDNIRMTESKFSVPVSKNNKIEDELVTPEGMEKLEWDNEGMGNQFETEDDSDCIRDRWSSFYKRYAEILDYSSAFLHSNVKQDVNQSDIHGRTALHYAVEQGHIASVNLLIEAGCRMNSGDTDSVTPLHLAATRGHTEVVRLLLHYDAKVNCKTSDKISSLHIAASRGYSDIVALLLDHGAKVDTLDASDQTPLLLSVWRGHHQVVELLINRGAKVNIEEIRGYTPLCYAVWQSDVVLVKLLLSAGARLTQSHFLLHYAILHRHSVMIQLLLEAGSVIHFRDDNGDTPLTLAAKTGQANVVEVLLENGANANYPNGVTGATPLHEAVHCIQDNDYPIFAKIFYKLHHYNVLLDSETFTPGDTPLYRALLLERDQAAALLIRHGSDVNSGCVYSCNITNMCLAYRRKSLYLTRLLVHAGFDFRSIPIADFEILNSPSGDVNSFLVHMIRNPFKLSELCRLTIRQHLRNNVYGTVQKSDLPKSIKKFLLLEDIQEV